MRDENRTKLAADALQSKATEARNWTAPPPTASDKDGRTNYGSSQSRPDPLLVMSPRPTAARS